MTQYLGEEIVDIVGTDFENHTPKDWAMYWIESYGQIDGGYHKAWVLDQVARILKGTPIIVKLAKWKDGQKEYRVSLDNPSQDYIVWVNEMLGEHDKENDEYEYEYDTGIAP